MRIQLRRGRVECRAERRKPLIQNASHAQVLGALAGEHEHRLAGRSRAAHHDARAVLAGDHTGKPVHQLHAVGAHHHRPMLEQRAGCGQRPAHIHRVEIWMLFGPGQQPLRLVRQRRC